MVLCSIDVIVGAVLNIVFAKFINAGFAVFLRIGHNHYFIIWFAFEEYFYDGWHNMIAISNQLAGNIIIFKSIANDSRVAMMQSADGIKGMGYA